MVARARVGSTGLTPASIVLSGIVKSSDAETPMASPMAITVSARRDDQGQHAAGGSAERHAQADLRPSRRDGVGHHAVQTHQREQQTKTAERREQNPGPAAKCNLESRRLAQRLDSDDRRGIEHLQRLARIARTLPLASPPTRTWTIGSHGRCAYRVSTTSGCGSSVKQQELRVGYDANDFRVRLIACANEHRRADPHQAEVPSWQKPD